MPVDLRLMRYAVAVADEGGFQNAARRLHIAQPALSRQIRQLERELGVELFERRPTRLTEAGTVFVDAARQVLGRVSRAVDDTRRAGNGQTGVVLRIGYTLTALVEEAPALLNWLHEHHPAIEARGSTLRAVELLEALERCDLDMVIGRNLPDWQGIARVTLRRDRVAAVVRETHRLAERDAIALRELRGETLRTCPRDFSPGVYDRAVAALQSTGEEFEVWHNPHPELHCYFAVRDLGGFALWPESLSGPLPGEVALVPLTDELRPVDLELLWRSDDTAAATEIVVADARRLFALSDVPAEPDPDITVRHGAISLRSLL